MPIVAEAYEVVVGADTHAASHTLVAVNAGIGSELAQGTFPTSRAGLARARAWVLRHGGDPCWASPV